MATAKLFQHGGSQAVRLPKAFRFDGTEVVIEKRGDEVVLKPVFRPDLKTLQDVAHYMRAARSYGVIRADLEKKGTSIGPLDTLIAAHAKSLGAAVVTGNLEEFRRVKGLKVIPWK